MSVRRPAVGIDATPLASGHATRGIGRHLARTFEAAMEVAPSWAGQDLGTLLVADQTAPLPGMTWQTRRSTIRPQDLNPFVAVVADRLAIRRRPPRAWHHTDPLIPSSPLPPRRTIVSVYDAIPLHEAEAWAGIRRHRRIAYRRYLALAVASRGVIASLTSTAVDIGDVVGIPAERIAVVPPYVRRLGDDGAIDPRIEIMDGRRRFLFVGVLEPHKRPELAIDAIAELTRRGESASLCFVGARPAHRRAVLERRASDLRVADRISFVPRPDDETLDALYGRSTLLATSRIEGFGQPPVEAILAGGRVVAVPIPAYLETVGGIASFAVDATAGALADAALTFTDPPAAPARATLAVRFGAVAATDALRAAYDRFGQT